MQRSRRVTRSSAARPYRRSAVTGLGAYKRRSLAPRRSYRGGKGAYYVSGGMYARGKLPGLGKLGAAMNAGYSQGMVSAPTLAGLGAYSVSNIKHNVLIKPDIPQVMNTIYSEGGTIVRHREYLGPITTAATANTFKIQSYALQPAQDESFPWLHQIAASYEEYRPNGIMYEFRSTASDAIASSSNLALGQVMLCTQYDPTDPEFNSDIQMLNYSWAQSGKVSDCLQHYVECDPKQSPLSHLYTRNGTAANESDLRFSDFGRFSIATNGLQGTSVQIGQLWVTYEFIFYKPKLPVNSAVPGGFFHYHNDNNVSTNQPLGDSVDATIDPESNLELTIQDSYAPSTPDAAVVFPAASQPQSYMITWSYFGTSTASVVSPNLGGTTDPGITFVNYNYNNTDPQIDNPASAATTTQCCSVSWITIDGDGLPHTLILAPGVIPATPSVDLYICQIPYLNPALYP